MIQDATFIHSDPGHAKADKPRGNEAKSKGYDATMKRAARGHTLEIKDILRNIRG